jgi:FkbM family methyltransferase
VRAAEAATLAVARELGPVDEVIVGGAGGGAHAGRCAAGLAARGPCRGDQRRRDRTRGRAGRWSRASCWSGAPASLPPPVGHWRAHLDADNLTTDCPNSMERGAMKLPVDFADHNYRIPKLVLTEVYPLTPFLIHYDHLNIVDVGANIGLWCQAFFQVFGKFVVNYDAIEPMPGNVLELSKRTNDKPVRIISSGVGNDDGDVVIHFDQEKTTLASICNTSSTLPNRTINLDKTMTVRQSKLDTLYASAPTKEIHLLKVDVEGYEMEVFQGSSSLFSSKAIRNVFFEFGTHNTSRGHSVKMVFQELTSQGFTLYKAIRGRNYFGLNRISRYDVDLEPQEKVVVDMYLASLETPSVAYRGPRVIGQIN